MDGMLGRKLGMMRVFDGEGRVRGVTVIELGPCWVTQLRTPNATATSAVQVGFTGSRKRINARSVATCAQPASTEVLTVLHGVPR